MESLGVKYRPTDLKDVCSQEVIRKVLEKQLETGRFNSSYLFCGPSGCGKTTVARILAKGINQGAGTPTEIDGASNNGVEAIKTIISDAQERSIDSEYKVIIMDECQSVTAQGWNAFLKCLEEPPKYTIFIFCTTDPQKVPETIRNRMVRFNFTRVKDSDIENRLSFVCQQEGYTNYSDGVKTIAKLSEGGMRTAMSYLEKCAGYSNDITSDNVLKAVGRFSMPEMFALTNNLIDGKDTEIISFIDSLYSAGASLHLFLDQYTDFVLDLCKYCLFGKTDVLSIPGSYEKDLKFVTSIDSSTRYFNWMVNSLMNLRFQSKGDSMEKDVIEVGMLRISHMEGYRK